LSKGKEDAKKLHYVARKRVFSLVKKWVTQIVRKRQKCVKALVYKEKMTVENLVENVNNSL